MRIPREPVGLLALACCLAYCQATAQADFSEAQNLAVTVCPSLLAPDSLVQRIADDLQLIRTQYPAVANIHYQRCNYYLPGETCILLTPQARALFLAGEHEQLNALHAEIGTPQIYEGIYGFLYLSFALPYHPRRLEELYDPIPGVTNTDRVMGCLGDGDGITIRGDASYSFRRAWGEECIDTCPYEHFWIFTVTGGEVTLVDEYGADLDPVLQCTWGTLKAKFR